MISIFKAYLTPVSSQVKVTPSWVCGTLLTMAGSEGCPYESLGVSCGQPALLVVVGALQFPAFSIWTGLRHFTHPGEAVDGAITAPHLTFLNVKVHGHQV